MSAHDSRAPWLVLGLLSFLLSFTASAQTFLLAGVLDDEDRPVAAGPLPFSFELLDGDAIVWSEEQPAVDVVGGVFVVDVGSATPLPSSVPSNARLRVTVDGDALPLVPLAYLARAARAARATSATAATEAERLQGHVAAEFVGPDALAVPRLPFVGFDHVTGVPAELANGDDGAVVMSTAGGVALRADGTLVLENVAGDRLADGSVTGIRFQNGAVGARHVANGVVDGRHVADGSLTRAKLDTDLTTREVRTSQVYRVDDVSCSDARGTLTLSSSCSPSRCLRGIGEEGRVQCGAPDLCTNPVNAVCPNTAVGHLVLP